MSNAPKQAFAHYLRSCGLPVSAVHLYDEEGPVSVLVSLDQHETAQFLRYAFRFDLAARFDEAVDSLNLVVRHNGRSEYTYEDYKSPDVALTAEELEQIRSIYQARFHDPLQRIASIVTLINEALEGPAPTVIREFITPGGFTVRLSALPDPDSYFETGLSSEDWQVFEELERDPYVFCQLDCVVLDPDGEEVGAAYLGRTSESYQDVAAFKAAIWRHHGRDLVKRAVRSARKAYPLHQPVKLKQAA